MAEVESLPGGVARMSVEAPQTPAEAPPPAADPNRPAWLPKKFKTPEDMAKAYAEAEAKLTQQSQTQAAPQETPEATPQGTPQETPEADPTGGKVDMAALRAEFGEHGKLTDESYAKLAAAGFDRGTVDAYIGGQMQAAEAQRTAILTSAGLTEESWGAAVQWATTGGMTTEERVQFNAMTAQGGKAAELALRDLKARFETATGGTGPARSLTGLSTAPVLAGYRDHSEMIRDMQDPRYRTSEAFRQDVVRKVAASAF